MSLTCSMNVYDSKAGQLRLWVPSDSLLHHLTFCVVAFVVSTVRSESLDAKSEYRGTNIKVSMKSLSATLNKERYPLAKAVVSNLILDVEQRGPDQQFAGSIGYISLSDMSPHGALYRERYEMFFEASYFSQCCVVLALLPSVLEYLFNALYFIRCYIRINVFYQIHHVR